MNISKIITQLLILSFIGFSCNPGSVENKQETNVTAGDTQLPAAPPLSDTEEHQIVAEESINTKNYTYIRGSKGDGQYWVAVSKQVIETGKTYYFTESLMMENFHSAELNRDFETIYFVSNIYTEAGKPETGTVTAMPGSADLNTPQEIVNVIHAPGAIKLSDLLAAPEKYKGKKVIVTGKCVKFNSAIMNRNWVHIQDGTKGNPDLTVTTDATVKEGDIMTFEGTLALDKDFGAGYKYPVILEGAVIK
jgi:hypothetical protein